MTTYKEKADSLNTEEPRTLYECEYARVQGSRIYCYKGHIIARQTGKSYLEISLLARGTSLAMSFCQQCKDFKSMGPPVPANEKGWLEQLNCGESE